MKTTQDTIENTNEDTGNAGCEWCGTNDRAHGSLLCLDCMGGTVRQKLELWSEMREALKAALPQVSRFQCTDPNGERCGNPTLSQVESILARADKIGKGGQ